MLLILGVVSTIVLFVASILSFRIFIIALLAIKPFLDFTWDITLFDIGGMSINFLRLIGLLVFLKVGFQYLSRRGNVRIFNETIAWAFIGLYLFTSSVAIATQGISAVSAANVFLRLCDAYLIYFTCHRLLGDEKDKLQIVGVIWISTLLVSFFSAALYIQGTYAIDVSQGVERFAGIYNDPGNPSYNAVLSFAFGTLFLELYERRSRFIPLTIRLVHIVTLFIMLFMLTITLTKSAVLMLVTFLVLWYGLYRRQLLIIIPVLLVGSYYTYTTSDEVQMRLAMEMEFLTADEFSLERARGIGGGRVGTYEILLTHYYDNYNWFQKVFGKARTYGIHNQYIAFLMQMGLVGLAVFLSLLARFYRRLLSLYVRYKHPEHFMGITVLSMFVIVGMSGSPFYYTTFLWYLMILLSFINIPDERPEPEGVGRGPQPRIMGASPRL